MASAFLSSRSDPQVVDDLLKSYSGDLAFDVGANGGDVSLLLAERFKKVVAYEPCEESFTRLSELGPPIVPELLALSSLGGEVDLIEADKAMETGQLVTGRSLAFSWGNSLRTRTVSSSSLDTEMEKHGVPDFVKIDTEGHEAKVVVGGLELFTHKPALLIEIHDQVNAGLIEAMLPQYDFTRITHPGYLPGSVGAVNHFWIHG